MDAEHGGVSRNVALFENCITNESLRNSISAGHSATGPPVSPRQPQVVLQDPFYDSVPREENISYIDG